jgi:hypothetical protein
VTFKEKKATVLRITKTETGMVKVGKVLNSFSSSVHGPKGMEPISIF